MCHVSEPVYIFTQKSKLHIKAYIISLLTTLVYTLYK